MSNPSSTGSVGGGDGIVIPAPSGSADSVVIFLHGLGDTAAGWASGFPLPGLDSTKYVLPTAPKAPVTLNGGAAMPSWFDIAGLDSSSREDGPGIAAAAARVARIVADEVAAGIPVERIVVGGFSQGGAVALAAALKSPHVFAGLIGLSTWLPLVVSKGDVSGAMGKVPVFLAHGDADQVIALRWAQASVDVLKKLGVEAEMKVYGGMAHSASNEELADVRRFLRKCFNPAKAP